MKNVQLVNINSSSLCNKLETVSTNDGTGLKYILFDKIMQFKNYQRQESVIIK